VGAPVRADRAALVAAARRIEERLDREVPEHERAAITEMAKRGLSVTRVDEGEGGDAWRALARTFAERMRAGLVPADVFDEAERQRAEFRARGAGGGR